jgi:cytoskeletal protein CcmA (bactofilin family)
MQQGEIMFRRKEEEEGMNTDMLETGSNENATSDSAASEAPKADKPAAPANETVTPQPAPKPVPAAAFRQQPSAAAAASMSRPSAAASGPASSPSGKASKRVLTVGHDIHMKGEISTCDRLVIEGSVDAELKEVHTVELAQTGSFKGSAEIEDAEISGTFEGDLIVNGRLIIYSTGKVSGNVSYGEIEIERGGQLSGAIKTVEEMKSSGSKDAKKAA